jgi:molybdopterin/thiamine biosynthesis adenylyltransferase
MLDSLRMEWNTMKIAQQPDCPVCGNTTMREAAR